MEYWQKRAKIKVSNFNFMDKKNEIEDAFSSLCRPLLEFSGIEFDESCSTLSIGSSTYSLHVRPDTIAIGYSSSLGKGLHKTFVITENMGYFYGDSLNRSMPDVKPLESLYFDYSEILNTIMNDVIG